VITLSAGVRRALHKTARDLAELPRELCVLYAINALSAFK
jgi:hypothetical protein